MKKYKQGFGPLLILLVVAVVLALGGGVYLNTHKDKVQDEGELKVNSNVSTDVSASTTVSSNGSLRSLLARGENSICTFNQTNGSSSARGTIYISGNMMRGDFVGSFNGGVAMTSHMLRNGNEVYVWSGAQGAQMNWGGMMAASNSTKVKSNVDLDQKVNYSCSSWTPDSTKFTLPTDVHFTNISNMMKDGLKATGTASVTASGTLKHFFGY